MAHAAAWVPVSTSWRFRMGSADVAALLLQAMQRHCQNEVKVMAIDTGVGLLIIGSSPELPFVIPGSASASAGASKV